MRGRRRDKRSQQTATPDSASRDGRGRRGRRSRRKGAGGTPPDEKPWYHEAAPLFTEPAGGAAAAPAAEAASGWSGGGTAVEEFPEPVESTDGAATAPTASPDFVPWAVGDSPEHPWHEAAPPGHAPPVMAAGNESSPAAVEAPPAALVPPTPAQPESETAQAPVAMEAAESVAVEAGAAEAADPAESVAVEADAAEAADAVPDAELDVEAEHPAPQRPFVHDGGPIPATEPPMIIPVRAYYMTRADDTLRSIAAQFLNSPSRWRELRSLNAAYPGIADAGPDDLLAVGSSLALPGDPMPWGRPDPVYLWTLAERFLYAAWGRDPSPEEVAPFWQGLTSGAPHLEGGPAPAALSEPPIPAAMQPLAAPPAPAEESEPPDSAEPSEPEPEPVAVSEPEPVAAEPVGAPAPVAAEAPPAVSPEAPVGEPAPVAAEAPPVEYEPPVVEPAPVAAEAPPVEYEPPPAPVAPEPPAVSPGPPVEYEPPVGEPAPVAAEAPPVEYEPPRAPVAPEPPVAGPQPPPWAPAPAAAEAPPAVSPGPPVVEPAPVAAEAPPVEYEPPRAPVAPEPPVAGPQPPPWAPAPVAPEPPVAGPQPPPWAPAPVAPEPPPWAPAPVAPEPPPAPSPAVGDPGAPLTDEAADPNLPAFLPSMTSAQRSLELPVEQVVSSGRRALAGTAIGDAMMLWKLGRMRRRRGAGAAPDPLELSLEQTARMDSLALIEAAMRHLRSVTVGQLKPKPRVLCVRTGTFGFEVLLERAIDAPEGWQAASGGYVLELPREVTIEQLNAAGRGSSLCPALVPVGDTQEGPLLLNIEEIGCLAVSGPNSATGTLLTSIVETLGSSPLAGDIRIITVGVAAPAGPGWERVHPTSYDSPELEHLLSTSHSATVSTGTGSVDVLIVGPGHDILFQRAGQIATVPGSRLALVGATSSVARWPWRIHIDEQSRAVVHPIAVNIAAAQAMRPELAHLLSETARGRDPAVF